MNSLRSTLLAAVTSVVLAAPAVAGIADSPLPVLSVGVDTLHLYSVPGVISVDDDSTDARRGRRRCERPGMVRATPGPDRGRRDSARAAEAPRVARLAT